MPCASKMLSSRRGTSVWSAKLRGTAPNVRQVARNATIVRLDCISLLLNIAVCESLETFQGAESLGSDMIVSSARDAKPAVSAEDLHGFLHWVVPVRMASDSSLCGIATYKEFYHKIPK